MIALLRVELRRVTARRTTRAIAALALLGMVVAAVVVLVHSGRTTTETFFNENGTVTTQRIVDEFFLTNLTEVFRGLSPLGVVLAGVLGATFVGAEWHTGSMATTLTWEPRRIRLWAGKALAGAVIVFALILFLQAALGLLLAAVAALRGSTEGVDRAWLARTAALGLRVALLSAFAATMAAAVAMVGRNTAAALGIGAIYLGVVEGLIRVYIHWSEAWLVGNNIAAFVGSPDGFSPVTGRSMVGAGFVLAVYVAGLVGVAGAVFRARDVT